MIVLKALKKLIGPAAVLLMMAGCATPNEKGMAALRANNMAAAERHFERAVSEGDPVAWNNLGAVYEHSERPYLAVQAYTLSARYGVPKAQQNLLRLGKPIPSADLMVVQQAVAEGPTAAELLLLGVGSYQDGKNSARSSYVPAAPISTKEKETTCTSQYNQFTKKVTTVCN